MSDSNGFGLSQLERQVHRSRANRPGPVSNAAGDSNQLARIKFDRSALEFDGKPPFNHQKCLIGVWMKMPVIRLCHGGNPNDMVIDLSNWMIVVSEMGGRLCLQRDDLRNASIHSQSSRPNSSPGPTLPGAPFPRVLLRMSGQSRSDPLSIDAPKCPNRRDLHTEKTKTEQ
jgi:hypothetical protein